ncbi:M24 family metallopeptidase [Acidicapsa dinghuensis]|uniref:M24 family metallopeptidase n=1 Tax=Acidicapsa dinghuensis TaxID=2218256 RepID=A0ABW1EFI5_9BACT|nr:M24 family metallopeptidase [Acidicapsa dinghuensis]
MGARISKSLVVNGTTLVTQEAWNAELEAKHNQVVEWLRGEGLDGLLLKRNENIAWLTGGAVELRVLTPSETGVAAILVTAEGRRYYFTTANEAPRLHDEEFGALDFEPVIFPWYDNDTDQQALELARGQVACDVPGTGFAHAHVYPLRASLQPTEIARFRWLGQQTSDAVTKVLKQLKPGITEYEMEGHVAEELLSRGILPSVYLMAVDERIVKYKHAVARGKKLEKYGMINLCARKWGLTVSITRFAHFGAVPEDLQQKFHASAQVNAALLDATRVGVTSAQLFKVAADAYAHEGFAGDEQLHHQGGATGYWEREWVATPTGSEQVVNNQVFAWNPSVRGGKVEDTALLTDGKIEVLTLTPELPALASSANGNSYPATGVLIL